MQPNVPPTGLRPQPGPGGPPRPQVNYQEVPGRIAMVRNQLEQGEQALASLNLVLSGPPRGGPAEVAAMQQKLKDLQILQGQRKEYLGKLVFMFGNYQ